MNYAVSKQDIFGQTKYLTDRNQWGKARQARVFSDWCEAAALAETHDADVVPAPFPFVSATVTCRSAVWGMILAALFTAPAVADGIAYWPATGERVYIIDSPRNIGQYGRMTKPRGVDRIVVRVGNKWGTVPSSLYNSKPAPAKPGYRYGRIR